MRCLDYYWGQAVGNGAFVVMQTVNCECSLLAALQWIMYIVCPAAAICIGGSEYECANMRII